MELLLLRGALKRGVLMVSANWPIVLIDFAVESFCRAAMALPVLGGALMVTSVVGLDVGRVVSGGIAGTADVVVGSLASAPAALGAFFGALALVAVGGEAVLFIVKAGTLSVIVRADRTAGEPQRLPLGIDALRLCRAFELRTLIDAGQRFARRGLIVALWLGAVYAAIGGVYLAVVAGGLFSLGSRWVPAWSALVLLATSGAVMVAVLANLAYTLLRVVIVTDDCDVGTAVGRLVRFVVEDARQVIGIFAAIGGIQVVAGALTLMTAAGLAPMAYLPLASLVVIPLQIAIWIVRGLLLESLSLCAVAAYQTQYRRFSDARHPAPG